MRRFSRSKSFVGEDAVRALYGIFTRRVSPPFSAQGGVCNVLKKLLIAFGVLLALPFVVLAGVVGYLLFAEWRDRMQNPPPPAPTTTTA